MTSGVCQFCGKAACLCTGEMTRHIDFGGRIVRVAISIASVSEERLALCDQDVTPCRSCLAEILIQSVGHAPAHVAHGPSSLKGQ